MGKGGAISESGRRKCKVCGKTKKLDKFRDIKAKSGKMYKSHTCKKCAVARTLWRQNNIPEVKERANHRKREHHQRLKYEVFDMYGGVCACCGEEDKRFLTIDHINGSGRKDREKIKKTMSSSGSYYYRWLRDQGVQSHLQVLCYNCNCGRNANGGICPHKDPLSLPTPVEVKVGKRWGEQKKMKV